MTQKTKLQNFFDWCGNIGKVITVGKAIFCAIFLIYPFIVIHFHKPKELDNWKMLENKRAVDERLFDIINKNCKKDVYLSFFYANNLYGTWYSLVSNHSLFSIDERVFLARQQNPISKNITNKLEMLGNISNREYFNAIYTKIYDISLIDKETILILEQSRVRRSPQELTKAQVENSAFFYYIFSNIKLKQYGIKAFKVYIYHIGSAKNINFLTLGFVDYENNDCNNPDVMKTVFNEAESILKDKDLI